MSSSTRPGRSPRDAIIRLAAGQDGLLSRQQALARGMTESALRARIRPGGRWQIVLPGVYATFTGPLTRRHRLRAGLLHAGEGALLSGSTAAEVYELRYAPRPGGRVEVLVHHSCKVGSTAFVTVRRTTRLPDEWTFAGAFPSCPCLALSSTLGEPCGRFKTYGPCSASPCSWA